MLQFLSYDVFFFFQAEDGIRDYKVTGVQTLLFRSADPVRDAAGAGAARDHSSDAAAASRRGPAADAAAYRYDATRAGRSEERRVGKECREESSASREERGVQRGNWGRC